MKKTLILPLLVATAFMSACVKPDHRQATSHSVDATLSTLSKAFNLAPKYNSTITQKKRVERALLRDAPIALINNFMGTLLIPNARQSAHEIMPLMHKSTYSLDKKTLDKYILDFSFKKAHQNAKFYRYPVKITRAVKNNVTALGHRSRGTAEAGHEVRYFLAKKTGANGVPAPITVFFPDSGAAPTISAMGSL